MKPSKNNTDSHLMAWRPFLKKMTSLKYLRSHAPLLNGKLSLLFQKFIASCSRQPAISNKQQRLHEGLYYRSQQSVALFPSIEWMNTYTYITYRI
jgi:hypothetical protein